MRQSLFALGFLAVALIAGLPCARADDSALSAKTLQAAIPGASSLRWGDALKTFLPDVAESSSDRIEAHTVKSFRHIDGDEVYVAPPDTLSLKNLAARDAVEQGKKRLIVLAEIEPPEDALGMALLALIDPAPQPRLLDLVDVAGDRENYLDDSTRLKIGRGADLIVTISAHLSAGEDAEIRRILYVRGDRIAKLTDVPLQSLMGCGFTTRQTLALSVVPDRGAEFDSLSVRVNERVERNEAECSEEKPPKPGETNFRTLFKWSARKGAFVAGTRDLDKLREHNSEPQ